MLLKPIWTKYTETSSPKILFPESSDWRPYVWYVNDFWRAFYSRRPAKLPP